MPGSSKRKKERKAQKRIEAKLAEVNQGDIPQSVATQPSIPEVENYQTEESYRLIFDKYNHSACELARLDSTGSRALINKLAELARRSPGTIAQTNLVRDNIENTGNYTDLFEGLGEDVELKEIQFAGTGRIICFFIDGVIKNDQVCNYCCIVAVLSQHR